jgi:hypothetical protein
LSAEPIPVPPHPSAADHEGGPPAEPSADWTLDEARAAYAELSRSEARFRDLVETAPAVSYVADYDDIGGLRYISP